MRKFSISSSSAQPGIQGRKRQVFNKPGIPILRMRMTVFLLLLTACTGGSSIYHRSDPVYHVKDAPPAELPKDYGYIIGTFTSDDPSLQREIFYSGMGIENSISDNNMLASDLKNGTFAIAMPAGDYEFIDYKVSSGMFSSIKPKYQFRLPFRVTAGRAVYIGNIHCRMFHDDAIFAFKDHAQSDIPLLLNTYPFIKPNTILVGLARTKDSIANIEFK